MKKIVFFTTALFLLSAMHILANGNYTLEWNKGNNFYQQKQYDSAAYYFEKLTALNPENAEIYYNLGNTYYRLNKIPKAILNYERALRYKPMYKDARENLTLAQVRIANRIPYSSDIFFIKWWHSITQPDKATIWAIATLIPFCIFISALIIRRFNSASARFLPGQLLGILLVSCFCFLVLAFFAARNREQYNGAVIMTNDAPLMNADLKGKPITLVPEGTTISITGRKDNWVEIRLPDGRTGWMQLSLMEKI